MLLISMKVWINKNIKVKWEILSVVNLNYLKWFYVNLCLKYKWNILDMMVYILLFLE